MFPTSRRYPRTLQEAFPQDYHDWLERPEKRHGSLVAGVFVCVVLIGIAAAVLMF